MIWEKGPCRPTVYLGCWDFQGYSALLLSQITVLVSDIMQQFFLADLNKFWIKISERLQCLD